MNPMMLESCLALLRRRDESSGLGGLGCFVVLLVIGVVVFLVMRGRRDKGETLGSAHRPMDSGPLDAHTFACPFSKCPSCGAAADKMKQQWDGLRHVSWSCGYCGYKQAQELKDEELPPSARQRLGLDAPAAPMGGGPGYYGGGPGGGSGMGGLLTGMMIGSMMGGGGHHHDGGSGGDGGDGWGGGDSGGSGSGNDWGDSGGSDWGGGDSGGGDWGGGGDSGGGSDW